MDKIDQILALNMVKLREGLGWNQDVLAENCELSRGTIQNYEGCKRWPEYENLVAIANALRVTTSRLFQDPDTIKEPTKEEAYNKISKELGFLPGKPVKIRTIVKESAASTDLSSVPDDILSLLSHIERWDVARAVLTPIANHAVKKNGKKEEVG